MTQSASTPSDASRSSSLAPAWHTDALLLMMALIWGMNYSVIKYAMAFMPSLAFNGLRVPIATIAQIGTARVLRRPPVPSALAWKLIGWGAVGNGVYQAFFIIGLSKTRVATAALLIAATPAIMAVMSRWHGTERFTRNQVIAIALQFIGCSSVAFGAASGKSGSDSLVGVLLVLAAAVTWAFYAIALRHYTEKVDTLQLGGYTMLGGALVMLVLAFPALRQTDFLALPVGAWLAVFYAGIVAMVVAYLIYYRGLRVIGPTRTSMYANLQPIIAMAIAWVALSERPTLLQAIGGSLIVSGLLLGRIQAEPAEA